MASFVDSQVFTDPGTTLADSHTASAAHELFLCASQRGTTGTSPGTLSYGGVDALTGTGGPITALCQTPSGQRAHRWYHIPRANHPGPGTHAISCVWAGVDNVAVCVVEVSATGEVTITANNQSSTNATVPITAGDGDLTIGCAQANSATPAFAPVNGQTEYEESVWYNNSGHVIGVQTGAQTAASWTGAGSICASAFVIHEESAEPDPIPIAIDGEILLLTGAFSLEQLIPIAVAGTVGPVDGDFAAELRIPLSLAGTVGPVEGDFAADLVIPATVAGTIGAPSGDFAVGLIVPLSLAGTVGPVGGEVSAELRIPVVIAGTVGPLAGAFAVEPTGPGASLAGTVGGLVGGVLVGLRIPLAVDGSVPLLVGAFEAGAQPDYTPAPAERTVLAPYEVRIVNAPAAGPETRTVLAGPGAARIVG